jgi:16S rRNA (adenine1518-N6/adenine1519-N6)-dimethyltransferase
MKRRALGQHYLRDPDVIERMLSAADIGPGESVVEIGTGEGVLTERLAVLGARLDGYEVDPENLRKTRARVGGAGAAVHLADGFLRKAGFDVLVSSLPYSRSQDFVEWISQAEYDRAVVLLQEDFVRKITAPPGDRSYRGVSAIAQISSEIEVLGRVPRGAFRPPPKVDSLMLAVRPRKRLSVPEVLRIKELFSLRRREVSSALAHLGLEGRTSGYGRRRVFSLTPEEVYGICGDRPAARDLSSRRKAGAWSPKASR